jgi:hypothetical protein
MRDAMTARRSSSSGDSARIASTASGVYTSEYAARAALRISIIGTSDAPGVYESTNGRIDGSEVNWSADAYRPGFDNLDSSIRHCLNRRL